MSAEEHQQTSSPLGRQVDPSCQGGGAGEQTEDTLQVSLLNHPPLIGRQSRVVISNAIGDGAGQDGTHPRGLDTQQLKETAARRSLYLT